MNIIQALETGLPFRRKGWAIWYDAANEQQIICKAGRKESNPESKLLPLRYDFLADDWEVQYPTIEITREEFYEACAAVLKNTLQRYAPFQSPCVDIRRLADKLFGAK